MNWFKLFTFIIALAGELLPQIEGAIAAGKSPDAVHTALTQHLAETPAKLAAV